MWVVDRESRRRTERETAAAYTYTINNLAQCCIYICIRAMTAATVLVAAKSHDFMAFHDIWDGVGSCLMFVS